MPRTWRSAPSREADRCDAGRSTRGTSPAELGERSLERTTHRNGYWPRQWDTRVGRLELAIPNLRQGSYFPSFLEPRRRAEQALVSVVQEA